MLDVQAFIRKNTHQSKSWRLLRFLPSLRDLDSLYAWSQAPSEGMQLVVAICAGRKGTASCMTEKFLDILPIIIMAESFLAAIPLLIAHRWGSASYWIAA